MTTGGVSPAAVPGFCLLAPPPPAGAPCVENVCKFFGLGLTCPVIAAQVPTLGDLYNIVYASIVGVDKYVLESVPSTLVSNLTWWYIRFSLLMVLPWVIVAIVVTIVMALSRVISTVTAVVLVVATLIAAAFVMFTLYIDAYGTVLSAFNAVKTNLQQNWDKNGAAFKSFVQAAYCQKAFCPSTTPVA